MDKKRRGYQIVVLIVFIWLFLLGLNLITTGVADAGASFVEGILDITRNPFIALFLGLVASAIFQSSSAVTTIAVGLVGSGILTIHLAIPIVVGANIGTTFTCTLASFAFLNKPGEFGRGFFVSQLHIIFNLLGALLILTLELTTELVSKMAFQLSEVLFNSFFSVLTIPLQYVFGLIRKLSDYFVTEHYIPSSFMVLAGTLLLFLSFSYFVRFTRQVQSVNGVSLLNRNLLSSKSKAAFTGFFLTSLIQSSSVTTSIMVPMAAQGQVRMRRVFPYLMGANLGTTLTAFVVALSISPIALAISIVHIVFNLATALLLILVKPLQLVLQNFARKTSQLAAQLAFFGPAYVVGFYFIIPLLLIALFKALH